MSGRLVDGRRAGGAGGGALGGARKKKRLVIKPYKEKPKIPANFLEDTWTTLASAVAAVHRSALAGLQQESLYRAVEGLCGHRMGEQLYQRLEAACNAHIESMLGELVSRGSRDSSVAFLEDLDRCWQEHCRQMQIIRSIFLVLDRKWVIPNSRTAIWEMGLLQFRKYFCRYTEVQQKAVEGLLQLLELDRRASHGVVNNKMLLKSLLRMMSELRIYKDIFEPQFLEATEHFYRAESVAKLGELDAAGFLEHAEGRLSGECERVANYMDPNTRRPLLRIVEDRLLRDHVKAILEKGFDSLVAAHRVADLARLCVGSFFLKCLPGIRLCIYVYMRTLSPKQSD